MRALCVCGSLFFFFPQLAGGLVCRFLWVIGPHSARVAPPAWLWLSSRENLSINLQCLDYCGLALLPPSPPNLWICISFLRTPKLSSLPCQSLSVSPCCQPLGCNWRQLWRGYYSSQRAVFGGGPGLHLELQLPKMQATTVLQVTSVGRLNLDLERFAH